MSEPVFFGWVYLFLALAVVLYRIGLSFARDKVEATIVQHKAVEYHGPYSHTQRRIAYQLVFSYHYKEKPYTTEYRIKTSRKENPVGKVVKLMVSRRDPQKVILLRRAGFFTVMPLFLALLGILLILLGEHLPG